MSPIVHALASCHSYLGGGGLYNAVIYQQENRELKRQPVGDPRLPQCPRTQHHVSTASLDIKLA